MSHQKGDVAGSVYSCSDTEALRCAFCDNESETVNFKEKFICKDCLGSIKEHYRASE